MTSHDARPRPIVCDLVVVGGGAAGLTTAIFAARAEPRLSVRCVDGAARIGAKILVSGGARCNVTNRSVDEHDFWGGSPRLVRRVLKAFPVERTIEWFEAMGVSLCEEEGGKLFPETNRSRTVLEALVAEASRHGVVIDRRRRVAEIHKTQTGFEITCEDGACYRSRAVVLATGGRSLPKTGSDGFGYELARGLGHRLVETTPALAPLVLVGAAHQGLAGIAHAAALSLVVHGRVTVRREGALLWTHFGISGPVALDFSRHWHRAHLRSQAETNRRPELSLDVRLNVCPGETLESIDPWLQEQGRARPRARVTTILASRLPSAVAEVWTDLVNLDRDGTFAHLSRDDRRRLARGLVDTGLDVRDSRGYGVAEVTAGGVALEEIDAATMESRVCPRLFLAGEILDVDGRLGGFNFQWAWASGWVAGHGVARSLG